MILGFGMLFVGGSLMKQTIAPLAERTVQRNITRLMGGICEPRGGVVLTDMSIDLERISDHSINIAALQNT